jgi:hypothetical protein
LWKFGRANPGYGNFTERPVSPAIVLIDEGAINPKENPTMRPILLATTTAVALAFTQAAGMAQTAHDQTPTMKSPANQTTHAKEGMRAQIRDMLQNAGFTDIKVVPGSFLQWISLWPAILQARGS